MPEAGVRAFARNQSYVPRACHKLISLNAQVLDSLQRATNGGSLIRGCIIDNDDFDIDACGKGALNRTRQQLRPAVSGNDDRSPWHLVFRFRSQNRDEQSMDGG